MQASEEKAKSKTLLENVQKKPQVRAISKKKGEKEEEIINPNIILLQAQDSRC